MLFVLMCIDQVPFDITSIVCIITAKNNVIKAQTCHTDFPIVSQI